MVLALPDDLPDRVSLDKKEIMVRIFIALFLMYGYSAKYKIPIFKHYGRTERSAIAATIVIIPFFFSLCTCLYNISFYTIPILRRLASQNKSIVIS